MKVAMLLSGGVDSSVALRLLLDQGHDVTAFYLKIWLQEEFTFLGDCPWEDDLGYGRAVCEQLKVPLQVIPLQTEYWNSVIKYTIDEIRIGRTPNPDLFCNNMVKFGEFLKRIEDRYDKVASGHYAHVEELDGQFLLKRSPDPIKDQTYFLAYLNQQQLSRALFPLGPYTKSTVRELARSFDLPTQSRRDSQGLCFLGQIRFSDFVEQHLGKIPGDIVDVDSGETLGRHNGYYYYTIGQRQGLGLSHGPWYVVKKDIPDNRIYVSRQDNVAEKYRQRFLAGNFSWISGKRPEHNELQVKVRHGEKLYNCSLKFENDTRAVVTLDAADQGIAPGQIAVFYNEQTCLGGGMIIE